MKKRFLLIPAVGLPLLTIISAVSAYSSVTSKATQIKANAIVQTDVNNYSVVAPSWTHYLVGEKLDLRDLKVTYNDPEKGAIDVTNECKLDMQNGQELTQAGELDTTIQHNEFNNSFKIYVEKEPHEIQCTENVEKMGAINVQFKLMSNQECIFTGYQDGEGTLEIPDYVERDGIKYFIKQIPSDWSDGENDITGLIFNCEHLKKICDEAFKNTNCLDYYINHKLQLLEFPEGLEEIGDCAFFGTDYGCDKIKGYSFPSTLKKIGKEAFYKTPYIDGDDDNGELVFKSIPEIADNVFYLDGLLTHDCKWICGSTMEIAKAISNKLKINPCFSHSEDFLIPIISVQNKIINFKLGDITVKCGLNFDERCPSDAECTFLGYVSGKGTLVIPDHVEHEGIKYYIREIPADWSDGENDITGLEFTDDCRHLKIIACAAFRNTNCLDNYIDSFEKGSRKMLIFPEGLEEIGDCAFTGTDFGSHTIEGYVFPITIKKVSDTAFTERAPEFQQMHNLPNN